MISLDYSHLPSLQRHGINPDASPYASRGRSAPILVSPTSRVPAFYLLALSRAQARLFHIDHRRAKLIERVAGDKRLAVAPPNAASTNSPDRAEHQARRITDYTRRVAARCRAAIQSDPKALVLASVADLYVLYVNLNSYPLLVQEYVFGNPERKSVDQLRREAIRLVARGEQHYPLSRHTGPGAVPICSRRIANRNAPR